MALSRPRRLWICLCSGRRLCAQGLCPRALSLPQSRLHPGGQGARALKEVGGSCRQPRLTAPAGARQEAGCAFPGCAKIQAGRAAPRSADRCQGRLSCCPTGGVQAASPCVCVCVLPPAVHAGGLALGQQWRPCEGVVRAGGTRSGPSLSIQFWGPLWASDLLPRGPQGLQPCLGGGPQAAVSPERAAGAETTLGCPIQRQPEDDDATGWRWGVVPGDSWALPSVSCSHGVAETPEAHGREERSLGAGRGFSAEAEEGWCEPRLYNS